MFGSSRFTQTKGVHVTIAQAALDVIFDECDRYDADETGGRILGTYRNDGDQLEIVVSGIIEPGPAAQRSSVYFMQDGAYQEQVFREVEPVHPAIEHLGNWHTHHVNGLRHLSDGDLQTYHRIVNHHNHNTDFFYALLVTERSRKTGLNRYQVKHYLIRRSDNKSYEIPTSAVKVTDQPLVWPKLPLSANSGQSNVQANPSPDDAANRVFDRDAAERFFPRMKTFMSKELGVYWRGPVLLIDGTEVEVVVTEQSVDGIAAFNVTVRKPSGVIESVAANLGDMSFRSCREALISVERMSNFALFQLAQQR